MALHWNSGLEMAEIAPASGLISLGAMVSEPRQVVNDQVGDHGLSTGEMTLTRQ